MAVEKKPTIIKTNSPDHRPSKGCLVAGGIFGTATTAALLLHLFLPEGNRIPAAELSNQIPTITPTSELFDNSAWNNIMQDAGGDPISNDELPDRSTLVCTPVNNTQNPGDTLPGVPLGLDKGLVLNPPRDGQELPAVPANVLVCPSIIANAGSVCYILEFSEAFKNFHNIPNGGEVCVTTTQ